jgi:hypothetical protein
LNAGRKQLAEKGPNLATSPASPYPAALKTVVPPAAMVFYLDTKTLFERLYDKVKPMVAFSLLGNPELGKHFDSAKLPQASTISRHLQPVAVSYGTDREGWVLESTGPVSFIGSYLLAVPAAIVGWRTAPIPATPAAQPAPAAPLPPAPAPR